MFRQRGIMTGGEKMPTQVHLSKKELNGLIEGGKAAGNDTSELENFLAELPSEKAARNPPPPARTLGPGKAPQELVTGPELERLRALACPHIRGSPYWEDFVSRRVLACSDCHRAGVPLGEKLQPKLL